MRIEHVTLLVKNREATLDFFKRRLGFDYKFVGEHAWVIVGEQYIHITENSGSPISNTFYHFAVECDDFEDYITKIKSEGVEIEDETPGSNIFIRDLDGNLIEFTKPWKP